MNALGSMRTIVSVVLAMLVPLKSAAGDPLAAWHVRQLPGQTTKENFEGVAYGNGRWVVAGENGTLLSSPDGEHWEAEVNPTGASGFTDVAFGGGMFVVVGRSSEVLLTSADGRNWVNGRTGKSGIFEVIHDGSRFLGVSPGGFLSTSTNGTTWVDAGKVPMNYVDVGGVAYGNGQYVVAGYMRKGKPTDLFSSPDLKTWGFRDSKVNENLMNVCFGAGVFVGVGMDGTLITSADGVDWMPRDAKHTGFIWDVASDGRNLVAAAQWGRMLVSRNGGVDWNSYDTQLPGHLTDVAFGGGTYVAVGWDGQIVQSDPIQNTPAADDLRLMHPEWRGSTFAFSFAAEIGGQYEIQGSEDGREWTKLATLEANANPMHPTDLQASAMCGLYRVIRVR